MTNKSSKGLLNKALYQKELSENSKLLTSIIGNIPSGFDAPDKVFHFLCSYLDIKSGALLFFNNEKQHYFHVLSHNFDFNTISRLTINNEKASELNLKTIRNFLSYSDFKKTTNFYSIQFEYLNNKALLIITDSRMNMNEKSYETLEKNKALTAEKIFSFYRVLATPSLILKPLPYNFNKFMSEFCEEKNSSDFIYLNFRDIIKTEDLTIKNSLFEYENKIFLSIIQLFLDKIIKFERIGFGRFIIKLELLNDISEEQLQTHINNSIINNFGLNDLNLIKTVCYKYIKGAVPPEKIHSVLFKKGT